MFPLTLGPQPNLAAISRRARVVADWERRRGLRFILETRAPASAEAVEAEAQRWLGGHCRVEPLFPGHDPTPGRDAAARRLDRFFLATIPGVRAADLEQSPFDWAHQVRTRSKMFRSVEPDTPSAAYGPDEKETGLESSPFNCFLDSGQAPEDVSWSLRNLRVPQAWNLPLPDGGRARGEGVLVASLDTGWAEHADLEADALDLSRGWDFVDGGDPKDPLEASWTGFPGHGTATGSVIVSRPGSGRLTGVAPAAKLVPVRCTKSVVLVFNTDVARAISYAAEAGCHVITMSLGGIQRRALEAAVDYATGRNVIVLAAAGNCVRFVTAPAVYPNCLAVAASNIADRPWSGSCRGEAVAVAAPGEFVWTAHRAPRDTNTTEIHPSQGTSFGVANVAGVAALWLAYHGFERVYNRYAYPNGVPTVFRRLLRQTARQPAGWDSSLYGAGIVNAEALLRAELPEPDPGLESVAEPEAAEAAQGSGYLALLETQLGPEAARRRLAPLFGLGASASRAELAARVEPFGAELSELVLYGRAAGADETGEEAFAAADDAPPLEALVFEHGSRTLRAAATHRRRFHPVPPAPPPAPRDEDEAPAPEAIAPAAPPDPGRPSALAGELSRVLPNARELEEELGDDPDEVLARAFPDEDLERQQRAIVGGGVALESVKASELTTVPRQLRRTVLAAGREALRKVRQGGAKTRLTVEEEVGLEAIVATVGRPALLFQGGEFLAPSSPWEILDEFRDKIEATARSVGRIEVPDHPRVPYAGTGFLVAENVVMTNRHVAEIFAAQKGKKWVFKAGQTAGIGYTDDPGTGRPPEFDVEGVLGVHETMDLALLAVAGEGARPSPLTLAAEPRGPLPGRTVYVVGYPAEDSRNGAALARSIFLDVYNVKRLQPGKILEVLEDELVLRHDCSTLGGNSGSCVVDLETGKVLGLHFQGFYLKYNAGVALWGLRKDPLLKRAKVQFD